MSQPPATQGVQEAADSNAAAPKKRPRAKFVLAGLVAAFSIAGGVLYLRGLGKEATDDAFVEGHVANVAARTQGQVVRVLVKDNQEVEEGAILVELDDREAKVRGAVAQADLASARANVVAAEAQVTLVERSVNANLRQAKGAVTQANASASGARAAIDQAHADVTAAESRRALAEADLRRAQHLRDEDALAVSELDARRSAFEQADAALAQTRARLSGAQVGTTGAAGSIEMASGRLLAAQTGPEQIGAARAQLEVARARVLQAEASVDQAGLLLSYTTVRSPSRGIVSRRTVEAGQMVDPARPLMAITSLDDVWIVANFKEDQVAQMHPGQPVRVTIDTYSGGVFQAHVDSLSGATGARFSLLPPDNASGNFTKVVQRVPVLIRLDHKSDLMILRPGMSAYVLVTTKGG